MIDADRTSDKEQAERLTAEAAERLREEDFSDFLSRPFAEAVAEIVRSLGLSPDWLKLAERCAAAEAALAGKSGETDKEPIYTGPVEIRGLDEDADPPGPESPPPDGAVDWRKRRLGRWSP